MKTKEELLKSYDKIETKKGLSIVRQIPGNYVGSTRCLPGEKNSPALLHILQEVLSNSIDEAYAGFGNVIQVIIHDDNSVTVKDHGRGIPMGKDFDDVRRSLTVLGSSGKYDSSAYAMSAGLHGFGTKLSNALSKYIDVYSTRELEHVRYHVKYRLEKPLVEEKLSYNDQMPSGTSITFLPDDAIFDTINWDDDAVLHKISQSSFLTPKVKFVFTDERKPADDASDGSKFFQRIYYSENGLADYVAKIADSSKLIDGITAPISFNDSADINTVLRATAGNKNGEKFTAHIIVSGALIYTQDTGDTTISFVNGEPTTDGGPHVTGAKQAIYQAILDYAKQNKLLKSNQVIEPIDTRDGLVLTLLVKVPHEVLMFTSQTKTKLGTPEARQATYQVIYQSLVIYFSQHSDVAENVIYAILDSRDARLAAKNERKIARQSRKTKRKKAFVSDKLKTASSTDPKLKSLFLTEGLSASGNLTMIRDKKYQAVFPLKGKILNTWHNGLSKALKNEEISTIASVLGAGIGKDFNVNNLQYDKVIVTSDSDTDGSHIASLLIALFYKLFPGLIENGHLYRVVAPLYQAKLKNKRSGHVKYELAYSEEEHADYEKRLHEDLESGYELVGAEQRWKGLGSMNNEQTKRYLADPCYRKLFRITVGDAEAAKKMLNIWMGSKADPRKKQLFAEADFNNVSID